MADLPSQDLSLNVSLSAASKTWTVIGLIAGLLPFLISTSSSSSTTVNGQITSFAYRDNFALAGGAVALLCGIIAAISERKPSDVRTKRLLVAFAIVALGGFQIARGLGVFAG
jgi:hypothetical protein